jgi:hypothetical protein
MIMPSIMFIWGGITRDRWLQLVWNEHWRALSQPVPHPEESVDELAYVPHSTKLPERLTHLPDAKTDDWWLRHISGRFMSYSQLTSQMTFDPSAGISDIQYDASHASSYGTSDVRHERSRRDIWTRNTYNLFFIRRMFHFRDYSLYFILFKILYFIFLWVKI